MDNFIQIIKSNENKII